MEENKEQESSDRYKKDQFEVLEELGKGKRFDLRE